MKEKTMIAMQMVVKHENYETWLMWKEVRNERRLS